MNKLRSSVTMLALLTAAACGARADYPLDCIEQITAFPWEQPVTCPSDDSGS